jgi:hypothetical protein
MTTGGIGSTAGISLPTQIGANPFQPTAGAQANLIAQPGTNNRGFCSLSFGDKTFRFRTNPNQIWWDYQLITHVDETYGGRVIQLLGTRLGDLTVTIEAGMGGWSYVMQVVNYLRNMISDQRDGSTGTFEYTTRNWKLKVYAMNVPFQDEVTATTREMSLQFKIQEDVSGVVTQASLSAAFASLQEGIYAPGQNVHNEYNDNTKGDTPMGIASISPSYNLPNIVNPVDGNPLGNSAGGLNIFSGIPGLSSIPGLGSLFG